MYFLKEVIPKSIVSLFELLFHFSPSAFETSMNPLLSPLVGSIVSMDDQSLSTGAQHSLG